MTATPDGTCTTSVTPGTRRAPDASNDRTVAPNRGGRAITAVSMSGRWTSQVYTAAPVVLGRESTRGALRPISLKSRGSLRATLAGGVCRAAAGASSPKVARRPLAACVSTPRSTVIPPAGTCHACAAAATSMARAVAPARRSCSQELAIAVLPPVPCTGPHARLL